MRGFIVYGWELHRSVLGGERYPSRVAAQRLVRGSCLAQYVCVDDVVVRFLHERYTKRYEAKQYYLEGAVSNHDGGRI